MGYETAQYTQAIDLAGKLKAQFGNTLRITGHSLGGGLASAAAIVNDIGRTVTFNAAGVHPFTVERYGNSTLNDAPDLITAIRVEGEALSAQDLPTGTFWGFGWVGKIADAITWIMPDTVGTIYWIGGSSWDPYNRHLMPDVIDGLRNYK